MGGGGEEEEEQDSFICADGYLSGEPWSSRRHAAGRGLLSAHARRRQRRRAAQQWVARPAATPSPSQEDAWAPFPAAASCHCMPASSRPAACCPQPALPSLCRLCAEDEGVRVEDLDDMEVDAPEGECARQGRRLPGGGVNQRSCHVEWH